MATVTIKGFIHAQRIHDGETRFAFMTSEDMDRYGYIQVCSHEITFEVPDGFDMLTGYRDSLDRRMKEAQAEVANVEHEIALLTSAPRAFDFSDIDA